MSVLKAKKEDMNQQRRFLNFRQVCEVYTCKPTSGWRWAVHQAQKNGLNQCFIKRGRQIIFDTQKLDQWLAGEI